MDNLTLPEDIRKEFRVDSEGKAFVSIRGAARLADVSHSTLTEAFKDGRNSKVKVAQYLTEKGFDSGRFSDEGVSDLALVFILKYYAFKANQKKEQAERFHDAMTAIGVRTWIQRELGYQQPQSLTELEILHKTVGQMVENERRTRLLEAQQQATTQRVDVIEQRLDGLNSGNTGYQTVRAYCRLHNLKIPKSDALTIGKIAGRLCRERAIAIGTVADEMFGSVNSYPVEVLEEAITNFLQPVNS